MPRKRRYDSASFVPAQQSWWQSILAWLFPPRAHRVRREAVQSVPIYTETPPHVWQLREHGGQAKRLLSRHLRNEPTSRRACMADGMTDNAWRRARRILYHAGVTDASGICLYFGRNAENRLEAYMRKVEDRSRRAGHYISP